MERHIEKKHAIFNVKPQDNSNNAIIKCIGIVTDTELEKVTDKPLEYCEGKTESEKLIYELDKNMFVRFFKNAIPESFILRTKTLPVMYATVMYRDSMMSFSLLNIILKYEIQSKVENEKELFNTLLTGN